MLPPASCPTRTTSQAEQNPDAAPSQHLPPLAREENDGIPNLPLFFRRKLHEGAGRRSVSIS
jgi:hypothetical protein